MNKFQEEIQKRYGSFELSDDKNKLITDNIEEFITNISIKFVQYVLEHYPNTPNLDINKVFKEFTEQSYEK